MITDCIKGLEEKVKARVPFNEGDYLVDGLLYCGKCRTPKQGRFETAWGIREPYHLCKCEVERREREKRDQEAREMADKIRGYRTMGFPEAEMQNWTFEADDQTNRRLTSVMHRYVDHFPEMKKSGKGLLLFGEVGVGKSFYAACVVNALIDQGIPCLMTNFMRLTNTIQGMFEGKQDYIDSLNKFSLLAIDDLGVERGTETMNEMVYNIIDSRYRVGLPMIITTNTTADELKNPKDIHKARIYSRLMEMCIPIEVKGCDRRKKKLKDDFSEYKDLLGL